MRLVQGRRGWWCIARSGIALLPDGYVQQGRLSAAGHRGLRATGIAEPKPVTSYPLTVLTSTHCNLGCAYCFQNTGPARPGRADPPRIAAATLRPHTIRHIAEFARERLAAMGVSALHLVLFGGEPLLNPSGCVELLRRCGDIAVVTAAIISNGTLLGPHLAARLCRNGLRSVQVTLDGPGPTHDRIRTTRDGQGTYERVLDNMAAVLAATDLRFMVRINLTAAVLPWLPQLLDDVARRVDASRCTIQIVPVLAAGPGAGETLEPTRDAAHQVVGAYAHGQVLGFHTPLPTDGHCAFCGSRDGRTGAVVNADGTLFSCWESAGRPELAVGTVQTGYRNYRPEVWVSCTSPYRGRGRSFVDTVDAGLLELAWERRGQDADPPPAGAG